MVVNRWVHIVVLVAATAVSCDDDPSTGAQLAGDGGAAGAGSSAVCPAFPSDSDAGYLCPDELRGVSCTFPFECASGEQAIAMQCRDGYWLPDEAACNFPQDFCTSGSLWVSCVDGAWENARVSDRGPCPTEPPEAGSQCQESSFIGIPDCGYFCPDGETWTVARCATPNAWTYDDACLPQH